MKHDIHCCSRTTTKEGVDLPVLAEKLFRVKVHRVARA